MAAYRSAASACGRIAARKQDGAAHHATPCGQVVAGPGLRLADEVVRDRECLVPGALPAAVEDVLALLPPNVVGQTKTIRGAAAPLVQLARLLQIALDDRLPRQVLQRRHLLVRAGGRRDLDGVLEIVEAAEITSGDAGNSDRVQVARAVASRPNSSASASDARATSIARPLSLPIISVRESSWSTYAFSGEGLRASTSREAP